MNVLNPFFGVFVFLIAFLTAYFLKPKMKNQEVQISRYESIDGLRGFLAIGVFIHHATIWQQYFQIKTWEDPKSNLYVHLGATSVSFFFMITSFLFVSRILNSAENKINWKAFFISRFYRIAPMYYFTISLLFVIVMIATAFELKVNLFDFLQSILHWLLFTIFDNPDVNGFEMTKLINAGVVWSLPYEWLFYFVLPLLAIFIGKNRPSTFFIGISLVFVIAYFSVNGFATYNLLSFVGGAIAPFIIKYSNIKIKADNPVYSFVILICLFLIVQFPNSNNIPCKILSTIIFTLIAMGCSFFEIFKNSTVKFLGEICYSTYLCHGLILFVIIYFGIGMEKIQLFSTLEYILLIFGMTPIVVIVSHLGYKYIEYPYMAKGKRITKSIK